MSLLDKASLVTTPNAVKASKVYSIIPSNGNGDLTFTRATLATRTDSSALIANVASNVPRLNYDTVGGCPSLLLEPQRTNLVVRSEEFDNTVSWVNQVAGTGVSPIRTANTTISPNGTLTADTVLFNRGIGNDQADQSIIQQLITISTAATYYFYVYLKATASQDIGKQVFIRNVVTNTIQTITLTSSWVKYQISPTLTIGAQTFQIGNRGTLSASNSVSADIWGAQLELGSYPTSYIPTTTAAVTRNVDLMTLNNIYTNNLITSAGGTWFFELDNNIPLIRDVGASTFALQTSSTLATNAFIIKTAGGGTANRLFIGTRIANTEVALYTTLTNRIKVAIKWNGATADFFVNGVKVVTATAFTTTVMEYFTLAGADVPRYIKSMLLFPTPLTDTECINLTTL
jgi:hypothetical protein